MYFYKWRKIALTSDEVASSLPQYALTKVQLTCSKISSDPTTIVCGFSPWQKIAGISGDLFCSYDRYDIH
jgi:hypothetical protein